MKEATITPFAKPLYIMTKPVGAVCNLAVIIVTIWKNPSYMRNSRVM